MNPTITAQYEAMAPVKVGEFGVDALEDAMDLLVAAAKFNQKALENGKYDVLDALNLSSLIRPVNDVVDSAANLDDEALDLYDEEATFLIERTVVKAEEAGLSGKGISIAKQIARIQFGGLVLASMAIRK